MSLEHINEESQAISYDGDHLFVATIIFKETFTEKDMDWVREIFYDIELYANLKIIRVIHRPIYKVICPLNKMLDMLRKRFDGKAKIEIQIRGQKPFGLK